MKKIGIIALLVVILTGCGSKEPTKPLKFGTIPAEASLPMIIAYEKGFFTTDIEVIPFQAPTDRNAAAQSGQIDGLIADVMTALPMIESGVDVKITSDINEDFKLLASPNSGITSIKGFDGKHVAVIPKFFLQWVMDTMAESEGISYEMMNVPAFSARFEGLLNDQFEGLVFPEPQAGMLIEKGAILIAGSQEFGLKGGSIMFTTDSLTNNRAAVEDFYNGYNKAVDYLNETKAGEYVDILEKYGFPQEMEAYIDNRATKYQYAGVVPVDQFDNIMKWSQKQGLTTQDYSYDAVTDFKVNGSK
ncbi:ABC transporter substrate-binding protein [Erysipelothrix sp. HDW6C]|uniref:ABC transporter substrate-binding protein n=1 Tax=Erysipelothrix sp. HDW6C TaxID=2714930 RepID=UPI00140C9F7F|nr:ABC transporter substrate-binding protein [Erysipelothrix sp. HDW6C]QIK69727.1 ABC transporter substrate-binding protein [Erysipelothrix sp. HDW6C]